MNNNNRRSTGKLSGNESKDLIETVATRGKGPARQQRALIRLKDQNAGRGEPAVDITERVKIEDTYRDFSGRLISVQDAELQRIARELHDDLSQRMALLAIELQQLDQKIPGRQSPLHARIQHLWQRTQEISVDMHRLSYQLYPANLDHLGLVAGVQAFCEDLYRRQGLKIEFQHSGFPTDLKKEVRLCLFRIVQEALHNVIKHSGSTSASVVLEKSDQGVSLSISDQGCGFDTASARQAGGIGLISMGERLRIVGGEISIESQPSQGTHIKVSVPMACQS